MEVMKKKSIGGVEDKHYELFTPTHIKNFLESYNFRNIKVNYQKDTNIIINFPGFLIKRLLPHIKAVGYKN